MHESSGAAKLFLASNLISNVSGEATKNADETDFGHEWRRGGTLLAVIGYRYDSEADGQTTRRVAESGSGRSCVLRWSRGRLGPSRQNETIQNLNFIHPSITMKLESLEKLFVHELKDLYSAEKQIIEALPKMSAAAHSPRLKKAFDDHLQETLEHVARIEKVFTSLDFEPGGEHCAGAEGLIKEGDDMIGMEADPQVKDAGLICAAQRVEHYEMAGYGNAVALATALGYDDAVEILRETLEEEGKADRDLTHLAQREILFKAAVSKPY